MLFQAVLKRHPLIPVVPGAEHEGVAVPLLRPDSIRVRGQHSSRRNNAGPEEEGQSQDSIASEEDSLPSSAFSFSSRHSKVVNRTDQDEDEVEASVKHKCLIALFRTMFAYRPTVAARSMPPIYILRKLGFASVENNIWRI